MNESEMTGWFVGRIPDDWFVEVPVLDVDRDEILVTGTLTPPERAGDLEGEARRVAIASRIEHFREETRRARMGIAREAERAFGRKIAWGVRCGDVEETFTVLAAPAMTRLRMPERRVLDTLIDSGVARSRSEALAWCVRLVGRHQAEWLDELRDALQGVESVRERGPAA